MLRRQMRSWDGVLALGFGSGLARRAPGTFGTLVGVPLVLLGQWLGPFAFALLLLGGFALGVWVCQRVGERLGVSDHGAIVWDEIIGFGLAMLLAPPGWGWLLAGFVLFRLLDIAKPWPIGWVDRKLKGGLGVMADDLIAGLGVLALLELAQLTPYL
jgi:phosphatidylglycerophosphatase A